MLNVNGIKVLANVVSNTIWSAILEARKHSVWMMYLYVGYSVLCIGADGHKSQGFDTECEGLTIYS